MSNKEKLSLPAAILINVNIMLGAGVFINTVELSKRAGLMGCLAYPLIALLLLPLIVSIARLVHILPETGFYAFGSKLLHPFVGFLGTWAYFTGKLASSTLMIHVAISLLQSLFPLLASVPILLIDAAVFCSFVALNMLHIKTGSTIQVWFLIFKIIPIFFVITSGLFCCLSCNIHLATSNFAGLPLTIPLVLYAAAGFEATCSLISKIENPSCNGPRAIFISYGLVMFLAFLFQLFISLVIGQELSALSNYVSVFPAFLQHLFGNAVSHKLLGILYVAIASSSLGAAYGILFSNYWNLHALAQAGHLIKKDFFLKLNHHAVPYWCLITEGIIGLAYILLIKGEQIPLQQTSALAGTMAYTMSAAALTAWYVYQKKYAALWIPVLALCSCTFLISRCVQNFMLSGLYPLYLFFGFLMVGICMFVYTAIQAKKGAKCPECLE